MKKQICYNLSRLTTDCITALDFPIDSLVVSRLKICSIKRRNRPLQTERTIKSPLLKRMLMKTNRQFQMPKPPKPKTPSSSASRKQNASQKTNPNSRFTSSSNRQSSKKYQTYFRPGPVLLAAVIACVLSMGSSVYSIARQDSYGAYSEPVETAISDYALEYEILPLSMVDDNLLATVSITKPVELGEEYSSWIELEAESQIDSDIQSEYVSTIGFDCPQIWITTVFPDFEVLDDLSEVSISLDRDDDAWNSLDDYDYLLNDPDSADYETLLKAYRHANPQKYNTLTLLTDGVPEQSGIVSFQATPQAGVDYVDGKVNVVYKKDGQVVYGGIYDYNAVSSASKTFVYTPSVALPAYDSVELIDLHY